jgi:hypothetical protein
MANAASTWLPPYFFATLAAAAFGAFAGAWITSRMQAKRQVISELNNISAAMMLSYSIFNRTMALKKQFVVPMRDEYERARREYAETVANQSNRGATDATNVFRPRAELKTLPIQKMPTDLLERHVFEKISVGGRALAAAVELVGAIDALNRVIRFRNDFIATDLQRSSATSPRPFAERIFGLRTETGVTDERFPNSVAATVQLTDDCLFFSKVLADDLLRVGKAGRRRHIRRLMLGLPKIRGADWSPVEKAGLIPPLAAYAPWLDGFKITQPCWRRAFDRAWNALGRLKVARKL